MSNQRKHSSRQRIQKKKSRPSKPALRSLVEEAGEDFEDALFVSHGASR